MKTLSTTLLAAQKKPHRLPYIEAKISDYEAGIKRLAWQRLYEGSEPDNHHGIAFDGQGSMHRIRAEGSDLYHQKQELPFATPFPYTFPIALGEPPEFDTWTKIATNCAGPCAIAAYGAKVYIFYKPNEPNKLYKLYSHDYGDTWDGAQLVSYADVLSMAACWWGTTDTVVCFTLTANEISAVVLDTATQTIVQHRTVTFVVPHTHIIIDTYGIGATYNPFWPQCEIVFAGLQEGTPYNHYNLFRTWLSSTYYFGTPESFLMSPQGEDITYEYPDVHLPSGAQSYETNRIVAVEKYAGIAPYNRPLTCHVVKGTYWGDTTFTEPRPFLDIAPTYGLRLASTNSTNSTNPSWWLSRPNGVWRAPRPADPPLDISKDIVSLTQRTQSTQGTQQSLVLELDNSKGQYAKPQLLDKLNKRYELVLRLGYKTPAGGEAVDAGTYWIDSWEYRSATLQGRATGTSTLTLFCLDGWSLANRWTPRYQMRWNQPGATPRSVWQILYQLLARVGIKLTNTPPKPQSSAINNFYPDFTIQPGTQGTQGTQALNKLLSFVPDRLVFRGQYAFTKNPLASESSCYSYGTDHAILAGQYAEAVTISRARAIGRDASGNRILEEAQDWELLQLAIDILEQDYDPNLETATRAQERADAILRIQQTQATPATIVVPTNAGQELLDVVEVTDARCGISEKNYRVQAIQTDYDRRKGRYDQRLTIGAP